MGSMRSSANGFGPALRHGLGAAGGHGIVGRAVAATPLALLNGQFRGASGFRLGAGDQLVAAAIMLWTRNAPPGVAWTGGQPGQGSLAQVFRDGRFWRIVPLSFFLTGALLGFQGLWSGPYLFDALNLSSVEGGNVLVLLGIGSTLGFALSGWLADRFGLARVLVAASLVFVASQYALALTPGVGVVRLLYFVFGITGAFNIMTVAQARQIFPLSMTGKAVSAVNVFSIGGTFLLQWTMGLIIGAFPANAAGQYPPVAYSAALVFVATGTLLSLMWYWPMLRAEGRT